MSIQSKNGDEGQDHSEMIHALSERYHVDESMVRELYENKLSELRFQATITSFLPVLIERHVRNKILLSHDAR